MSFLISVRNVTFLFRFNARNVAIFYRRIGRNEKVRGPVMGLGGYPRILNTSEFS